MPTASDQYGGIWWIYKSYEGLIQRCQQWYSGGYYIVATFLALRYLSLSIADQDFFAFLARKKLVGVWVPQKLTTFLA